MVSTLVHLLILIFYSAALQGGQIHCSALSGGSPRISPFRLRDFVVDSEGLSILGFAFYDDRNTEYLHWVDHILGGSAVFYNWSGFSFTGDYNSGVAVGQELYKNYTVSLDFQLPIDFQEAAHTQLKESKQLTGGLNYCAIEIFAVMPAQGPAHIPFIGKAALTSRHHNLVWDCFFRAVNYRLHGRTYWNTELICPMPLASRQCVLMKAAATDNLPDDGLNFGLVMNIAEYNDIHKYHSDTMSAEFVIEHHRINKQILRAEEEDIYSFNTTAEEEVGVCTVWPYTIEESKDIDSAMIFEFVRHYSNLGMRMFIFDRDMKHLDGMFESAYAKAYLRLEGRQRLAKYKAHIISHNFTTLSLLNPSLRSSQISYNDHDKELTYSLCRFEAQALYGIHRILVVDYDEFLVCRGLAKADDNPLSKDSLKHAQFIRNLIRMREDTNGDSIAFLKTSLLMNWHNQSASNCVRDQIRKTELQMQTQAKLDDVNAVGSILHCFVGFKEDVRNVKELYLHRNCPATGIHNSCLLPHHYCTCHVTDLHPKDCAIAHLTLNERAYHSWNEQQPEGNESDGFFSPIWRIVNDHLLNPIDRKE